LAELLTFQKAWRRYNFVCVFFARQKGLFEQRKAFQKERAPFLRAYLHVLKQIIFSDKKKFYGTF
jgi:hypothetical protein